MAGVHGIVCFPSVETTVTTKLIQGSSGKTPSWHVMFGLHNRSNSKVMVLGITVRPSFGDQGPFKSVKWPEGNVILEKKDSFAGIGFSVSCTNINDPPSFAVKWQYRQVAGDMQPCNEIAKNKDKANRSGDQKPLRPPPGGSAQQQSRHPVSIFRKRFASFLEEPLGVLGKRLKSEE